MNDFEFDDEDVPLEMEELIEDAMDQLLAHEDPDQFCHWLQVHIYDYYTGPGADQNSLLDADPDESILTPELAKPLAFVLARALWNSTPLPSANFRTRPIPVPQRNDPCFCGSGLKFKKCCQDLPTVPIFGTDALWPLVYVRLPRDVAASAIHEGRIPVQALTVIAMEFLDKSKPKKVLPVLQHLFEGKISKTDETADLAMNILCDAYDSLGFDAKKERLLQAVIDNAPRSPLRSGAWQRLAAIRMDGGDSDGAWDAFRKGQRDDPDSVGLGALELQLLYALGRDDEAQERARFWQMRLRRAGLDEDEIPLQFVSAVVENPAEAFREIELMGTGDTERALVKWLDSVQQRPLPDYLVTIVQHDPDDEDRVPDFSRDFPPEPDVEQQAMYLLAPPELAALEDEWHRLFAFTKPHGINEFPIGGEHVWLPETEQQWSSWLQQHPRAFDSLDILDDLATAFYLHPQLGAHWLHDAIYLPVLQRAEAILEKSLASQEDPLLPWVFLQNRPPLRALARLALGVMMIERNDKKEEAMQRTQRLLALNPSDNQGFRGYVINQLLTQGKDSEALELADRYDGDMTPEIVFGRILALYREGETKQAVFELGDALDFLPKIPRYLTAKNIKQPKLDPGGITFGGDDQAWIYREDMRQVWEETEGALAWLKKAAAAFR